MHSNNLIWPWLALSKFFARLTEAANGLLLINSDKEITMSELTCIKAALAALLLTLAPAALAAESAQDGTPQSTQLGISLLDINSADASAIATALVGVGMVKAKEIVAYRELFGKFQSIDELADVRGIGAATVEKNRSRIVILAN